MKRFVLPALLFPLIFSCHHAGTLFQKRSASSTGITFNNKVTENDSINPIDMEFLYNGGGVIAGDFNNDSLQDLYFTASMISNKLYLNKGGFSFEDITEEAEVTGEGRWSNGASAVDINNDGLLDIYVCATIKKDPAERTNLLYINQGMDKNGVPKFREMAKEYGLADTGYSVHAAFFDYDNDGDLDMYLVQTKLAKREGAQFMRSNFGDSSHTDYDKLFRNDWNDSLKHPLFSDISAQAGITGPGFGLGINITDLNGDGWKDIYVTNDFFGSDALYLNAKNGTFVNKTSACLKHTSQNAMGNDIADINNDGLPDIVAVDMNPEDNYRKKKNMNGNNYFIYQNMIYEGYVLQYVKNTLQLNMGNRVLTNDTIGEPVFSDIAYYSGIAETDWSWNAAIADFDNDGSRDIFITNGYPRDVTDHDFGAFRSRSANIASKKDLIAQIPQIKISNYAYRNNGDARFQNRTKDWGLDQPSFSSGAIYVDLDNDGDLDYVINNINDPAFVYENTLNSKEKTNAGFLKIRFKGEQKNRNGLGAIATIYYDNGKKQVWENSPYRGYLSCVEPTVLFGLGKSRQIDSLVIRWNSGKTQLLRHISANQVIEVNEKDAVIGGAPSGDLLASNSLFTDVTSIYKVNYRHREADYIDFNTQRLLPHKLSEYGPGLAVADIDGNGLDDICIGGTGDYQVSFLMQQPDNVFLEKKLPFLAQRDARRPENTGILLFDADGDHDPDLYLTSGSSEFDAGSKNFQDRLFENDGKGNFTFRDSSLPENFTSKSCVKAADIDNDGDLDLFVGGRVLPGRYPEAVSSFLYRNDSKNGQIRFTDISAEMAPGLKNIGLVCDALFTDFDNDGSIDLVITGEWMPVQFFKNINGEFKNISAATGIDGYTGWWNSIAAGDFDNDGDIDYVAGNLGDNSYYRGDKAFPVRIYGGDFAHNKTYVGLSSLYLPDENGQKKEYPAQTRDDVVDQLPALKKKFLTYKSFAGAGIDQILDAKDIQTAYRLEANFFSSAYIENLGNGKFAMHELPWQAQIAPVYGMVADDINEDGYLDLALVGNDFGTEVAVGRYDALNGLILLGDGLGNFKPQSITESGLFVPGNGKALVKLRGASNSYLLAASENKGLLKIFKKRNAGELVTLANEDKFAICHLKNGKTRKEEIYHGSSFVSQSSSFLMLDNTISSIDIICPDNKIRKIISSSVKK